MSFKFKLIALVHGIYAGMDESCVGTDREREWRSKHAHAAMPGPRYAIIALGVTARRSEQVNIT